MLGMGELMVILATMDFKNVQVSQHLYVNSKGTCDTLIICFYVDDLIYTSNCDALLNECQQLMKNEFDIIDLGGMNFSLGLEIK